MDLPLEARGGSLMPTGKQNETVERFWVSESNGRFQIQAQYLISCVMLSRFLTSLSPSPTL